MRQRTAAEMAAIRHVLVKQLRRARITNLTAQLNNYLTLLGTETPQPEVPDRFARQMLERKGRAKALKEASGP